MQNLANMKQKHEIKSELLVHLVIARECKRNNDKCGWGAIDCTIYDAPDNTPGNAPKGALQVLYKDAKKGVLENALKGAL